MLQLKLDLLVTASVLTLCYSDGIARARPRMCIVQGPMSDKKPAAVDALPALTPLLPFFAHPER
ncbi:hypothetical protein J6590_007927 [Homalodisca vitripennis]|nr:hypothetical protein J6590_007927 [Homalodisca vitripennis]